MPINNPINNVAPEVTTSNANTWWIIAAIIILLLGLYLGLKNSRKANLAKENNIVITGETFENQYLKVTVPADWKLTETKNKTGAVNIIKGNYILYINPQANQASGVEGGRFAEISMGAPSSDLINTEPPSSPCGISENHPALEKHPRVDLYINKSSAQVWCKAPTKELTYWYFSYITNSDGSYFNYYKPGEALGYVITMSYSAKDIESLPIKDSKELKDAIATMTAIAKTMKIK